MNVAGGLSQASEPHITSQFAPETQLERLNTTVGDMNAENPFLLWMPRLRKGWRLLSWRMTTMGSALALGALLLGGTALLVPTAYQYYMPRYNLSLKNGADSMNIPNATPAYWVNQWRKQTTYLWKVVTLQDRYDSERFEHLERCTGIDYSQGKNVKSTEGKNRKPTALVPCCGDSIMVRELAERGFAVDAFDVSKFALINLAERTDRGLQLELFSAINAFEGDVFDHKVWSEKLRSQYNLIYDHLGLASIPRERREEYVFWLKKALAPKGALLVEGIFRTGRIRGNKVAGPPFQLLEKDLQELFPENIYNVKCSEKMDNVMAHLSRKQMVLKVIPKEMYVTAFPCAVWRK